MIARGCEQISRLLLGRWRFPKDASNGIRVCRLSSLDIVQLNLPRCGVWGIRIGLRPVCIDDLDLEMWLAGLMQNGEMRSYIIVIVF
jgi:hypothetical protein